MDEYLAHFRVLENALADCEHLLLHFRGPVCDLSWSVTAVTAGCVTCWPARASRCRRPYRGQRPECALAVHPGGLPRLAARAEAEICQQEVLAAAAARPSPGIRSRWTARPRSASSATCARGDQGRPGPPVAAPDGPGPLIIGRLGAGPALLEPTPVPIVQAAQLLGVPPAACAVVASTPDGIRTARQAGARAIGYARTAAARDQLTAAAPRQHRQHDPVRRPRLLHRTAPAARPWPRAGR